MTESEANSDGLKVRTAFLIVQHENGEWEAISGLSKAVTPEHPANVLEMKFGASEVVSDIEASKLAAITAHQLMAMTAQMQQAAQNPVPRRQPQTVAGPYGPTSLETMAMASSTSSVTWNSSRS
ncbi:hypothetical protein ACWD6R_23625 [Streptomyces sp. NPDC005151]